MPSRRVQRRMAESRYRVELDRAGRGVPFSFSKVRDAHIPNVGIPAKAAIQRLFTNATGLPLSRERRQRLK